MEKLTVDGSLDTFASGFYQKEDTFNHNNILDDDCCTCVDGECR